MARLETKKVLNQLQKNMEIEDERRKRDLFRRRIDLARQGVRHYQQKRVGDAIMAFNTYLKILEDWKGVSPGRLNPTQFDLKKDVAELLLISGVYWDLVKLYDRASSPQKKQEFFHYLDQYVAFSKGMPYQPVAAETIRKYMNYRQPVHAAEFKRAYRLLAINKCYVATALADRCAPQTLPLLRRFRDEQLAKTSGGRAFIRVYYRWGPLLADLTDRLPPFVRGLFAKALDLFARRAA